MALRPDYGETFISAEEAGALTTAALEILGDPIRKAWDIPVSDLLTDHFVRDLHDTAE